MKIKSLLPFFTLCIHSFILFGQGQTENLEKYWFYRDRLTTEFMVVGNDQGMSQAAATIFPSIKRINWSDNALQHGWYIGVLALEYHLLTSSDYAGFGRWDTTALTRTQNELQSALAALLRMDDTAETAFPLPCTSFGNMRNGFFIRDDVPRSFYVNFPGIDSLQSESTSTTNVYNSEMSQDQAYHVLLGLALVKKFIPNDLVVNGMHLRQEAIAEAGLIVEWINHAGWQIKNPACQNKNVLRGHDATLLSHGLNEVIKFISNGFVNYDDDVTPLFSTIWNTLTSPSNPGYANINNLHMAMVLAAIGNGWSDTTMRSLMTLAEANRWYVYPLLWVALYEDRTVPDYQAFEDTMDVWSQFMLDEAPADGPRNSYPDTSEHGYAVFNRFLRDWNLQYTGDSFNEGGIFNGLDYMMLHNLYYTAIPSKWVSSEEIASADQSVKLEIYPNPVADILYLRGNISQNEKYDLRIFNSIGKEVYQSSDIKNHSKINVQSYVPGVYFVVLMDKVGKTKSCRSFVKE